VSDSPNAQADVRPEAAVAVDAGSPQHRYTAELAGRIEADWQQVWTDRGTFNVPNPVGSLAPTDGSPVPADKMFVQDMFPYPSGDGLHVGHPLGYIATDVYARYFRMTGRNVLHALGFDAFGLPAEQYAVQTGTHPRTRTEANIVNFRRQLGRLGLGHDARRSFATTDTDFYKWTQWIFLQIYNAWFDVAQQKARPVAELIAEFDSGARTLDDGRDWSALTAAERAEVVDSYRLVYRSDSMVNWCPGLGTVLANEEVTSDGRSERGNFPVFRKRLRQWMMRITAYSDRLLEDLDVLDWPDKVKAMQRNWIGRSVGAEVLFSAGDADIEVFTTRPDTLFGATYLVLAPEHDLVDSLLADSWPAGVDERWTYGAATPAEAVAAYRAAIAAKSDLERQENKTKTGVFTGAYATNPVNGQQVPIFIADYVLAGYGTGAIMAVPGHDQRDWEFATAFGLPIVEVIAGGDLSESAYTGDGAVVNSDYLNGLNVADAKAAVTEKLVADLHCRLRAGRLRHRRHHGGARPRPARLGVRDCVRSAHRGSHCRWRSFGVRVHGRRRSGQFRLPRRPQRRRRQGRRHREADRGRPRPGPRRIQAARLAFRTPAVLGRAVPDRLRRRRPGPPAAGFSAARGTSGRARLLAGAVRPGQRRQRAVAAAEQGHRVGARRPRSGRRAAALHSRHQRHAAVGRQLLVRAALRRPAQLGRVLRQGERGLLDGPAARDPRRR